MGGDVIVAIDGHLVKGFDDLVTQPARTTEVGQIITLTALRQGHQTTVNVTLAARPTSETQASQAETREAGGASLGILGMTITPELAQATNLSRHQRGVLVERVEHGSPADRAGLRGSYKRVVMNGRRLSVGGHHRGLRRPIRDSDGGFTEALADGPPGPRGDPHGLAQCRAGSGGGGPGQALCADALTRGPITARALRLQLAVSPLGSLGPACVPVSVKTEGERGGIPCITKLVAGW